MYTSSADEKAGSSEQPPTHLPTVTNDPHFYLNSLSSVPNVSRQEEFAASGQHLPSYYAFQSGHGSSVPRRDEGSSKISRALFGWRVAFGSWLNIFLILIPISWATTIAMKESHGVTFVLCILSLIPLVRLHDLSTRELTNRIGGSRTGLLNGTVSNFVEIVVAISALRKCELRVVQSMLVGSMLSKLLLVLGLCFLAGGIKFTEQNFNATSTQVNTSLLSLSVGAVLLPAAFHFSLSGDNAASSDAQKAGILKMSHGVSIVLLLIYVFSLVFQLWSHTHLYKETRTTQSSRLSQVLRQKQQRRKAKSKLMAAGRGGSETPSEGEYGHNLHNSRPSQLFSPSPLSSTSDVQLVHRDSEAFEKTTLPPSISNPQVSQVEFPSPILMQRDFSYGNSGFSSANSTTPFVQHQPDNTSEVAEETKPLPKKEEPKLSWFLTIMLLITVTGAVSVSIDWLVEAMDEISTTISKEWVGLILLPAISSVAECLTAVRVSVRDDLSLSVSVAIGSTIQTALFVIPFTVILAWITDKPLSLLMDPFQSLVLYIAVNTMGYVVADGKSNWLDGLILICLYVIIAVSFWFYPGSSLPTSLAVCTPSVP